MTIKTLSALAILAAMPLAAAHADDYQYGYEKASATTTDENGVVSQTTVEKSWATQTPAPAKVTDVNAPADAQPGVVEGSEATTTTTTEATSDEAAGQRPASWYKENLQPNGRYVFDPESGKLVPVVEKSEIEELNKKAEQKAKAE